MFKATKRGSLPVVSVRLISRATKFYLQIGFVVFLISKAAKSGLVAPNGECLEKEAKMEITS